MVYPYVYSSLELGESIRQTYLMYKQNKIKDKYTLIKIGLDGMDRIDLAQDRDQ
jgi:hypothetical protein